MIKKDSKRSIYRVLIVGGGLQAISTARSLKGAGYIVGIWCDPKDYSTKSSAIAIRGFCHNDIDNHHLISFIKTNKFDVAIPMSDKICINLSKNKKQIESETNCCLAVPDYETLLNAADKRKLMDFCRDNNIPHPKTISANDTQNYKNLIFPLLIKPNHSVGARGITLVNDYDEFKILLPVIQEEFGECHLQEYISGNLPYYNVMLYRDSNGKCINHAILKIIRFYPLNGGSSSMCQTVDIPELRNLCVNVLDKLNYHGFADFDVLQNENNEYKIIEINPRVPASLRGASISGINFPAIMCADVMKQEIPTYTYHTGKTLRYLGLDVMWFMSSSKRFKSNPSWFKFFGKNVFYQEGGFKDFKPMLYSLLENINKIEYRNGKIKKKLT